MELLSNIFNKIKMNVLFEGKFVKVIDVNGDESTQEKDRVICIPYLVETNSILLKYQNVPTFELIKPEIDKYVMAMSASVDKDVEESLREGLEREFSIVLKEDTKPEILQPIFAYRFSTMKYHICILPLMSHEYEMVREDDAKVMEMKDANVVVNINEINNLIIYDMATRYAIDLFKKSYSLF